LPPESEIKPADLNAFEPAISDSQGARFSFHRLLRSVELTYLTLNIPASSPM
jgi:hypothetical protein